MKSVPMVTSYDNALIHLMDATASAIGPMSEHAATRPAAIALAQALGMAQEFRRMAGAPDCGPELEVFEVGIGSGGTGLAFGGTD